MKRAPDRLNCVKTARYALGEVRYARLKCCRSDTALPKPACCAIDSIGCCVVSSMRCA